MNEINTLLNYNSNVLLIAPTGWGKTTLLLDLVSKSPKRWLYLAPLRALANEFYLRSSKKIKGTILVKHHKEIKEIINSSIDFKLLIITPELLNLEYLEKLSVNTTVVFDEIHLFYYWGKSFRPRLIESYEDVMALKIPSLSLSATMSDELLQKWNDDSKRNYEKNFVINLNNHELKKNPRRILKVYSFFKDDLLANIYSLPTKNSKLIFCAYRNEVMALKKKIRSLGYSAVSCVGGETLQFQLELADCPKPDFIIATTAISHGVNLPKISIVYISYKVKNYDFWVQMVGRAGRRGESFTVYSMDKYRISKKDQYLSILYLLFIKLKNKMIPYEFRRYTYSQNTLQR